MSMSGPFRNGMRSHAHAMAHAIMKYAVRSSLAINFLIARPKKYNKYKINK